MSWDVEVIKCSMDFCGTPEELMRLGQRLKNEQLPKEDLTELRKYYTHTMKEIRKKT